MTRQGIYTIAALLLATVGTIVYGVSGSDSSDRAFDHTPIGGPRADRAKGLTPRSGAIDCPDVPIATYTTDLGTHRWSASFTAVENTDCATATRLAKAWWWANPEEAAGIPAGWTCYRHDHCKNGAARVIWARKAVASPAVSSS